MEKNKDVKADKNLSNSELVFSKEQLIRSNKFKKYRDALAVCLKDGEKYTINEAEKALSLFLKGR